MRVIEDTKECWAVSRVNNGYQVVIKRLDGGLEFHSSPVLVKLAEDVLIRVEPGTLRASIMKSSLRKAKKDGTYDDLLKKVIKYLVVGEAPKDAVLRSYAKWSESKRLDEIIVPTFNIIRYNVFSANGRSGITDV